jgi:hypothetical protein
MWPFKKKQLQKECIADNENEYEKETARLIDQLKSWRPIGAKFSYVGVDMVVTSHIQFRAAGLRVYQVPSIHADYADKNGVIRSYIFSTAKSIALMESNP